MGLRLLPRAFRRGTGSALLSRESRLTIVLHRGWRSSFRGPLRVENILERILSPSKPTPRTRPFVAFPSSARGSLRQSPKKIVKPCRYLCLADRCFLGFCIFFFRFFFFFFFFRPSEAEVCQACLMFGHLDGPMGGSVSRRKRGSNGGRVRFLRTMFDDV